MKEEVKEIMQAIIKEWKAQDRVCTLDFFLTFYSDHLEVNKEELKELFHTTTTN